MAPELFEGESSSARSDIYSMGVLLDYLVSGSFPVEGRSMNELIEHHRDGPSMLLRDRRSDLPESFVAVVERALSRDPGARFATAGEMEQALSATLGVAPPLKRSGRRAEAGCPSPPLPVRWSWSRSSSGCGPC